jgi:cyclopropane-fatty-acyl-phospholipid synthase
MVSRPLVARSLHGTGEEDVAGRSVERAPLAHLLELLLTREALPDWLIRAGIRRLLVARLREVDPGDDTSRTAALAAFAAELRHAPLAPATPAANAQHYEVPAGFFQVLLGPRLKYSSALWPAGVDDLAAAEEAMLALTAERAAIADGQRVLELGCGWGSLGLWLLERFPRLRLVAVTSSREQRDFVHGEAVRRGVDGRLGVLCADVGELVPGERFDRVVSVEMFEHLRNWPLLLGRIGGWLSPAGRLFLHVFCHRHVAYPFTTGGGAGDWMARNFFTGGMMPAAGLIDHCADGWTVEQRWLLDGTHYSRTAAAWLANLDARRAEAIAALAATPDPRPATGRLAAWRVFVMACEELFAFRGGSEWGVAHWRLRPR